MFKLKSQILELKSFIYVPRTSFHESHFEKWCPSLALRALTVADYRSGVWGENRIIRYLVCQVLFSSLYMFSHLIFLPTQ